jgi:hypothetical protein
VARVAGETPAGTKTGLIIVCQFFIIAACAATGVAVCRRTVTLVSNPSLEALLKRARHLWLALPPLTLLPAASVYITANPSLQWDLPWILQLHSEAHETKHTAKSIAGAKTVE